MSVPRRPEGRNKIERRRIESLIRRMRWLESLEASHDANDWDRAEGVAIRWALDRIAEAEEAEKCSTPTT
jgi:hypothetical protein